MSIIQRVWSVWKDRGPAEFLQLVRKRISSQTPYLLFEQTWTPEVAAAYTPADEILYRPGCRADVPGILEAWPEGYVPGFTTEWDDPAARPRVLEERFDQNLPCFLGVDRATGRILCGAWCVPWEYDSVLPVELRDRPAFEISAAFSCKEARRKFSITGNLIRYAMLEMGRAHGVHVSYSRSQSLKRAPSPSFGARKLGYLVHGVSWGRPYSRLLAELPAKERKKRGLRPGGSSCVRQ